MDILKCYKVESEKVLMRNNLAITLLSLFIFWSCNPTERSTVDYSQFDGTAVSTFSYTIKSIELIQDVTEFSTIPQKNMVASYDISPELPRGLDLDPVSGEIYGVATETQTQTEYIISAVTQQGTNEIAKFSSQLLANPLS